MGCQRSRNTLFLGVMLLNLYQSVIGRFVVEKNSFRVTSPDSLKGTHDSAIGNFGIPQYGGSMAGTVVYPKDNRKGCKSFDDFGISFKSKPGSLPTFVLVDCGRKMATEVKSAWAAVWVILIGLAMAGGGAHLVYKYRLRSYIGLGDQSHNGTIHVSDDRA